MVQSARKLCFPNNYRAFARQGTTSSQGNAATASRLTVPAVQAHPAPPWSVGSSKEDNAP